MIKFRILSIVLAIAVVLGAFAGCNSSESTGNNTSSSPSRAASSRAQSSEAVSEVDEVSSVSITSSVKPVESNTTSSDETIGPKAFSELLTNVYEGSVVKEDAVDTKGNNYIDAYVFYAQFEHLNSGKKCFGKPYIEKYLGNEYTQFEATVVGQKNLDKYAKGYGAVVKIYADEELVYTSENIIRKGNPQKISLNITGVEYLKIQIEPTSLVENNVQNIYNVIVSDAKVSV